MNSTSNANNELDKSFDRKANVDKFSNKVEFIYVPSI